MTASSASEEAATESAHPSSRYLLRPQGSGCRVQGFGVLVYDLGFKRLDGVRPVGKREGRRRLSQ